MNNKTGYIIGFVSAAIYTFVMHGTDFTLINFIASIIGALLVPIIIAIPINLLSKSKNLGKIFGITCIVVHILAGVGNISN
ncbi:MULTISPECIES: hypothetical protein [unclassified Arenibacter]|uniref:hypothetical protein n=1 Tax=unclassified Arenibacter TaxID=2615047 RepID=UPI000E34BA80|nr:MULTISPECIES: hypothetical protein [unclassified Arenibacter]MCM4162796.1 hypothetical protein [Arenibacter sp. A80]RFT56849.1 hypothetical protein D0S24_04245 [Arenibacter sp. P308M17]